MNQLVAFIAPTALPTAAGAQVRAQGTAQGSVFATILAQVQNTIAAAGSVPLDPTAQQQVTNLLGQLPPGLVQAVKSLSTDELATQLQSLADAATGSETPELDALLGAIAPTMPAAPTQPSHNAVPANNTSLGAILQALHQKTQPAATAAVAETNTTPTGPTSETPVQSAPAPTQADLGLRGSVTLEQAPQQQSTKADAAAIAKLVENAAAVAPNTARARPEAPAQSTQQNKTTADVANGKRKLTPAPVVEGGATTQPSTAQSTGKSVETPTLEGGSQTQANASQTSANVAAPLAQPKADAAVQTATPSYATVAAPALPTLVDAQQMSVTLSAAPQTGVPLEALAVQIARKFEAGVSQFEITLHPAELGQLDISLTVADDGHVQAVLRAERQETLDILQRDARSLEQQLRQAGLEVGSNALSFSLSGGNGQQRHAPFVGWPAFAEAQDAAAAAKQNAAVAYLAVRKPDGIDIRV